MPGSGVREPPRKKKGREGEKTSNSIGKKKPTCPSAYSAACCTNVLVVGKGGGSHGGIGGGSLREVGQCHIEKEKGKKD